MRVPTCHYVYAFTPLYGVRIAEMAGLHIRRELSRHDRVLYYISAANQREMRRHAP